MISEVVVFGIVWGALLIYFLTPFKSKNKQVSQKLMNEVAFTNILKDSLIQIVKHKKAVLALMMLILSLISIWSYHSQLEWYNHAHGVGEVMIRPKEQAIYYMVSIIVYSVIIYFYLAFRRTLLIMKKHY